VANQSLAKSKSIASVAQQPVKAFSIADGSSAEQAPAGAAGSKPVRVI